MTTEEKARAYAERYEAKPMAETAIRAYIAGHFEALASQWKDPKVELPEDATQCLVFLPGSYDDNIVRLAWYDGDKFHDAQTDQRYRPSFWMPIPIPPLKGGEE